jgi:hypothetical protein
MARRISLPVFSKGVLRGRAAASISAASTFTAPLKAFTYSLLQSGPAAER